MISQERRGLALGLANVFVYGLLAPCSNHFVKQIDPLLFASAITLVGATPFLIYLGATRKLYQLVERQFLKDFLIVSFFTALGSLFFFVGTSLTSAINTGLLEQSEPVFALLLGSLFLGERFSKRELLAGLLMILGAICVVYRGATTINMGDVLVACGPLFFQLGHLRAKQILPRLPGTTVLTAARLLYGGLMLLLCSLLSNPGTLESLAEPRIWFILIPFGLFFRSLDMLLWYRALKLLPLAKLSALFPIGAGVSFIGSIVIVGETAIPQQLLGLGLILTGLIGLSWKTQAAN